MDLPSDRHRKPAKIPLRPDRAEFRQDRRLSGDADALGRDAALRAGIQHEIDRYNSGKPHHEQIRAFALLPRELTIEAGEITPTLRIKRKVIDERYKALIDRMYEEKAHAA